MWKPSELQRTVSWPQPCCFKGGRKAVVTLAYTDILCRSEERAKRRPKREPAMKVLPR